jgi:hypothetical protein
VGQAHNLIGARCAQILPLRVQRERFGVWGREISRQSQETLLSIICNADMRVGKIRKFCKLQDEASELDAGGDIVLCITKLNLFAWSSHQ